MSNNPIEKKTLSTDQLLQQVHHIRDVLTNVMKKDVHYGVIPGTKNPTLLKPGAEKLLSTFRIATQVFVEDLSTTDSIMYRVKVQGVHMGSGVVIGEGIGECSTDEEKYRWRDTVCQQEYDYYPAERKRVVWKKVWDRHAHRYSAPQPVLQVRTEFRDKGNTILKMAKKRAQIDLCLTALSASDVFDTPATPPPQQPQPAKQQPEPVHSEAVRLIDDKQVVFIGELIQKHSINASDFLHEFTINSIDQLPASKMNEAVNWITE